MAMLQLGGVLSNPTVRINPRLSWLTSTQQMLFASSIASDPKISDDRGLKQGKLNKDILSKDGALQKLSSQKSVISNVFKNLMKPESEEIKINSTINPITLINRKIYNALNINEVLEIVKDPDFTRENAPIVVSKLYKLVSDGIGRVDEFESDERYAKVCNYLKKRKDIGTEDFAQRLSPDFGSSIFGALNLNSVLHQINKQNFSDCLKLLTTLAYKKKRSLPILQTLSKKITNSNEKLTIKQLADILYSLSILNFPDEPILKRSCQDLLKVIPGNENSAVIGSIITSIGHLRYRNRALLTLLTTWIIDNQNIIRPQEISSLLLTLATIGYSPPNFKNFYEKVISPLKESDMCETKEWLDVVWSLTILNKAYSIHYQSVLNDSFQNRLFDLNALNTSKEHKLLNVNAAAKLALDYNGPCLPLDSPLFNTSIARTKDKYKLVNSIVGALKVLLPSSSTFLNTNIDTKMGFLLDAEFCIDEKGNAVPIGSSSESKLIYKIAVVTSCYHDYCRGESEEPLGYMNFAIRLLALKGYNVLHIPYTDINIDDKLITRVKYINEKLKVIVHRNDIK